MSKGIKLNHDENYSRRLQKTLGGNPRGKGREATRWDRLAQPRYRLALAVAPAYQLLEYSSTASLDFIYAVLQVGLIQGLTLDPLGYIRRPQPPLRHQVV
jgi:hypothetical protein